MGHETTINPLQIANEKYRDRWGLDEDGVIEVSIKSLIYADGSINRSMESIMDKLYYGILADNDVNSLNNALFSWSKNRIEILLYLLRRYKEKNPQAESVESDFDFNPFLKVYINSIIEGNTL